MDHRDAQDRFAHSSRRGPSKTRKSTRSNRDYDYDYDGEESHKSRRLRVHKHTRRSTEKGSLRGVSRERSSKITDDRTRHYDKHSESRRGPERDYRRHGSDNDLDTDRSNNHSTYGERQIVPYAYGVFNQSGDLSGEPADTSRQVQNTSDTGSRRRHRDRLTSRSAQDEVGTMGRWLQGLTVREETEVTVSEETEVIVSEETEVEPSIFRRRTKSPEPEFHRKAKEKAKREKDRAAQYVPPMTIKYSPTSPRYTGTVRYRDALGVYPPRGPVSAESGYQINSNRQLSATSAHRKCPEICLESH